MAEFLIEMIRAKDEQTVRLDVGERPVPADYTKKERDTIAVGFKALIGPKRTALRTLTAIMENPKYTRFDRKLSEYKQKLSEIIMEDCTKVIDIIQSYCMSRRGNRVESEVFFNKIIGDFSRYQCEVMKQGADLKAMKDQAKEYYE